jgi:micrococcal nuclease
MYEYKAKYLGNYDGDTIDFEVDLGFKIHHIIKVRLGRIDTPELRSKQWQQKQRAYAAKDFVKKALSSAKNITILTYKDKTGKYGRYIADVVYDGNNLSDALLERKLADPYYQSK